MRQPDPASPPLGQPDELATCLNCEAPLTGAYCSACGQKRVDPRETLRGMIHDALGDVVAWDSRIARTLRWLITRPGHLSREWASGRRVRYVPPFRLYIWLTLILIGSNAVNRAATDWLHVHEGPEIEDASSKLEFAEGSAYGRISVAMKAWADIWLRNFFVTTPLIGYFFYVFFRRWHPTYPPHFVIGLELASYGVVLLVLFRWLRIIWVLVPPHLPMFEAFPWLSPVSLVSILMATLIMSTLAIRRFYGLSTWRALAASPLLLLAPVTVLVAVSFAVTFVVLTFS